MPHHNVENMVDVCFNQGRQLRDSFFACLADNDKHRNSRNANPNDSREAESSQRKSHAQLSNAGEKEL